MESFIFPLAPESPRMSLTEPDNRTQLTINLTSDSGDNYKIIIEPSAPVNQVGDLIAYHEFPYTVGGLQPGVSYNVTVEAIVGTKTTCVRNETASTTATICTGFARQFLNDFIENRYQNSKSERKTENQPL